MSPQKLTFQNALDRTRDLLNNSNHRVIIGIVGKPGAGKSTLSSFLLSELPSDLVSLIPMDGYHLSNKQLADLDRSDRKGAPDTFDSQGFAALLDRVKNSDTDIYFPIFHREIEESIAAEGIVTAKTKIVITEGNYLLHMDHGWAGVAELLSESWYVDVEDDLRLERLVDRHHFFGKERQAAYDWAHGTDERNAELVEATKSRADFIVMNESR
jgi:pantothenate kinase